MMDNVLKLFQQQSWFKRGLVIFFLLFMLFDIVFPENCAEENLATNSNDTEISFHFNSKSYEENLLTSIRSNEGDSITVDCSHHTHQNPSGQSDNDCCFCCCSHWLPAKKVKIERALINLPLPNSINLGFLPEAPSQKTFHPPKHS